MKNRLTRHLIYIPEENSINDSHQYFAEIPTCNPTIEEMNNLSRFILKKDEIGKKFGAIKIQSLKVNVYFLLANRIH